MPLVHPYIYIYIYIYIYGKFHENCTIDTIMYLDAFNVSLEGDLMFGV